MKKMDTIVCERFKLIFMAVHGLGYWQCGNNSDTIIDISLICHRYTV